MRSSALIIVALGCGFVASLGVYQYLRAASDKDELRTVLVATKEININQALSQENVRVEQWPRRQIPQGSLAQLPDIEGKFARIRLYAGEPILSAKVMNWDDASSSLKVPKGFRAVSVRVTMDQSVSSLIEPGDKVDVIVVVKRSPESPAMSKTILKSVQVFAVNTEMGKSPDKDKTLEDVRTVSLLLDPEGAERLAMGQELGIVRLTLRSPDDPLVDETPGCSMDRLFGLGTVADPDERGASDSVPARCAANNENRPAASVWSMVIETPDRAEGYTFESFSQMPRLDSIRYKSGNRPPWAAPAPPTDEPQNASPAAASAGLQGPSPPEHPDVS